MADQVKVEIVTVDAVSNLAELKAQISEAKKALDGMALGSKEYQDQLKEVIQGQNLLRAAMNGTTATAEELKAAVDAEGTSYNALVNQMANLKRAFRATTDEAERADLGGRIKAINDQLKEMDAMKGDFQRNVGDYFNQTSKAMKEVIKDLPSGLDAIKGPLRDIEGTMGLMSHQPIIGIIGLLSPILVQIAQALKEDDKAMGAVKKMGDALKPLLDFFSGILTNIVDILGDLIARTTDFIQNNGVIQKVINGVAGVGNAILQFIVAPIKGVIAAIKVFKEQGVKGLGDAGKAFVAEMKSGVAFKSNYEAGQAMVSTILSGARSRKNEIAETGTAIGKELSKAMTVSFDLENKEWLKNQENFAKDVENSINQYIAETSAEIDDWIENEKRMAEEEEFYQQAMAEAAEAAAERKKAAMEAYVSGVSNLMSTVADALESGDNASEASVKAAKNLRIAAATIDMISGAVTAFSVAQSLGPIAGPIVGAINAAAVVAAGLANIAKIKSTSVSKKTTPTTASPTPATVEAPQLDTATPTTVTTGASTERALNAASQPQKVYILQSDIEAAGDTAQVQVAESSF